MTRWEPGAAERLAQAALDLYAERGFEQTTVAEIAKRAGLTERTFFRHYADKREVLFAGAGALQEPMVTAVQDAPDATAPIDAVAEGLRAGAAVLEPRRPFSRQRQAVIAANTELQERELIKLARLGGGAVGRAAAARRGGPHSEPDRGGGDRRVQDRLRTLGGRERGPRALTAHPGVAGRAPRGDGRSARLTADPAA